MLVDHYFHLSPLRNPSTLSMQVLRRVGSACSSPASRWPCPAEMVRPPPRRAAMATRTEPTEPMAPMEPMEPMERRRRLRRMRLGGPGFPVFFNIAIVSAVSIQQFTVDFPAISSWFPSYKGYKHGFLMGIFHSNALPCHILPPWPVKEAMGHLEPLKRRRLGHLPSLWRWWATDQYECLQEGRLGGHIRTYIYIYIYMYLYTYIMNDTCILYQWYTCNNQNTWELS